MRWPVKQKEKVGAKKTVKRFALWPRRIDQINIWLESYWQVYEWKWETFYVDGFEGEHLTWVLVDSYLKETLPEAKVVK